jgi:hypothetical protein
MASLLRPKCRFSVLVIAGFVALASPALAAPSRTVAIMPPSGDNVAPEVLKAAGELLKDHLLRTNAYHVVTPPSFAPVETEATPEEAAKLATDLGAQQAVSLRITHFGTSARVRINAYAAGTGQVVYWDSIVISGGPDELDTVIQRLVHAMLKGKPVHDSAEIDTVTTKEGQQLTRRAANQTFGLRLFTLLPVSDFDDSHTAIPGGGIYWLYDARSWMADISLDLGARENYGFYDVAIGVYYPFLREDFTPYVGGTVRLAYMKLGGDGASGMSLQPTVGILLGRLSTVQLRAELGYFFNTFGEGPKTYYYDEPSAPPSTSKHYGNGAILNIGLGF